MSRIPREDRLCPCGVIQTEEHVICHCPLSDHFRSQFGAVSFSNIADFWRSGRSLSYDFVDF